MNLRAFVPWLVFLGLVLGGPANADTPGIGKKPDVRLLIDVSGSMKTSDPDNLRAPAVELLVRMLPEGSRAGIWLFGDGVRELVPHGEVDEEWRKRARRGMERIDNSGQRTNIPAALDAATFDFDRLDPGYRISIILLTDGKVDVAESPMQNATAARNILTQRAVTLGQTGIPVHTIALSSEADWVFLRSLAATTNGIAEQADSATELGGVFLQSLDIVAPTVRVPLAGSRFSIDASVEEFTVLIFFENGRKRVRLVNPAGDKWGPSDDLQGVSWVVNDQFAVVTVTSPTPGDWQVQAPRDTSARVSVISDLQLQVDPVPSSLPAGRQAELGIRLVEKGQPVLDPDVLGAFSLYVDITGPGGSRERIDVIGNYPFPADGEYRVLLPPFVRSGRHSLIVHLQAGALQRELPLLVEVAAPPEESTLVTRGQAPPADDFKAPLTGLVAAIVAVLLVVWWVLRRRKRRKLELWQRRAQNAAKLSDDFPVAGLTAGREPEDRSLD
jgi:hypothetical protein